MRLQIGGEVGAADLHLDDLVALLLVAAHLGTQAFELLARVVVAAARIDQHRGVVPAAVEALREQPPQRLSRDLGDGIPHGHVERPGRMRPVAVAAGLLVGHEGLPDRERIEVVVGLVDERLGLGRQDARDEPLAQDAALRVAAVGGEAVADHRLAVAHHVGLDRDQADGHGRERDEGVADLGRDRRRGFADAGDLHGRPVTPPPCACPAGSTASRWRTRSICPRRS